MKIKNYLNTCLAIVSLLLSASAHAGSATWSSSPATGNWNTAGNWMPATVPNGPADTATFGSSSLTNLSLTAGVEVNGIAFNPGAAAFTITNNPQGKLTVSGVGVTNNSGVLQNFVNLESTHGSGELHFTQSASAGDSVVYTSPTPQFAGPSPVIQFEDHATAATAQFLNYAGTYSSPGGLIEFQGNSNAGSATFRNTGTFDGQSFPHINFRDRASAGQAVFINEDFAGGMVTFFEQATADHATFTSGGPFSAVHFNNNSTAGSASILNEGGTYYLGGAITYFVDRSSGGEGTFIANGSRYNGLDGFAQVALFTEATAARGTFMANPGQVAGAGGGVVYLYNSATADRGTFIANGSAVSGAFGGKVSFYVDASANEATLVANGGVEVGSGGGIFFRDNSTGDTARVELHGNGFLDLQLHAANGVTIGSLEGDGLVLLGNSNLSVGSNDSSTTFSGVIQDGTGVTTSSFTKIGSGTLALTGANTYNGPTVIQGGRLVINNQSGLALGHGPVTVEAGTLGGRGPIAGAVTVGTGSGSGAILAPGRLGGKPAALTLQSALTFHSDATCVIGLNTKAGAVDRIVANGVIIESAQFSLHSRGRQVIPQNRVLTVISNTAATPIAGTFANLPDGSTISDGLNTFRVRYSGGEGGNDLTLTVVP